MFSASGAAALNIVKEVANHANDIMKQGVSGDIISFQRSLENDS